MTEPTDSKMAFVLMVKDHLKCQHVVTIAKIMASDQYNAFWQAPFAHGSGRWDRAGGLAEATLLGYRALRFIMAASNQLYLKVDEDRMVAIYLTLMISRWANVRTMQVTFERTQPTAVTSVALANAVAFGIDLTPPEAQALSRWFAARSELLNDHEGFTSEWWILSEVMNWVFVANRR